MLKEFRQQLEKRIENGSLILEGNKGRVEMSSVMRMLRRTGKGSVAYCNVYIEGIEKNKAALQEDFGFVCWTPEGNVLNIDHHAPIKKFKRRVTAVELAILYYRRHKAVDEDTAVVVNYTDTDSVLSALIILGLLDAFPVSVRKNREKSFIDAAHSAHYTGKENALADILQAVQSMNNLGYSAMELLAYIETGEVSALKTMTQDELRNRQEERIIVSKEMTSGRIRGQYRKSDKVGHIRMPKMIGDPLFWTDLSCGVWVFVAFIQVGAKEDKRWNIRARVTARGSGNVRLDELGLYELVPDWSGGWNFGSNMGSGGCEIDPDVFVHFLSTRIGKQGRKQMRLRQRIDEEYPIEFQKDKSRPEPFVPRRGARVESLSQEGRKKGADAFVRKV